MNIKLIEKIVDAIKNVSELCQKTIEAGDPEKYAKSVENLHQGVSDTYDQMRQIIVNSDKFTEDEKLERLAKLAKQEEESKEKCGAAIRENRENVASIVLSVAKGLLTCGIYYIPGVFKALTASEAKALASDEDSLVFIEDEVSTKSESV